MDNNSFFEIQTASSKIKASIVAEYFPSYCKILLKREQSEIRYLDLFSGPGKYEDGNYSTPLLIAKACINDTLLSKKVRLLFNDNNKEYINKLESYIKEEKLYSLFTFEPRFGNQTVGEDQTITNYLTKKYNAPKNPHPTLLFFDPWGYKGIDTMVLSKFLEGWGNELFLFVNIKRIHAAIENNKFDELMTTLFPTSIKKIRNDRKYAASVPERLSLIIENLADEFKNAVKGTLYSCAFKFQEEDSHTTSHYIIHFTKHHKGYELVKQIYYDFDNIGASLDKDGNYTFDAKALAYDKNSTLNFGDENILSLSSKLNKEYKGKKITGKKLFEEHHTKTQYCASHYTKTLRWMYDEEKTINVILNDNINHMKSVFLTDNCIIEFNG